MNRTTLITLGLSIAACTGSSSSPTSTSSPSPSPTSNSAPTAVDYEDAAQEIASSTVTGNGTGGVGAGDVLAMSDALNLVRGRLPFGFIRDKPGHAHCNHMGVDNAFTITCKDAAGTVQQECNSTTDSATVEIKWSGSIQSPIFSSSVDREGTWTITGLQSDVATFNGNSSFSLDSTMTSVFHKDKDVTSTLMYDATAAYNAITITTKDHAFTGGSADFEVKMHRTVTGTGGTGTGGSGSGSGSGTGSGTGSGSGSGTGSGSGSGSGSGTGSGSGSGSGHGGDVDKSFDVTAKLTFNGDGTATLVLDGTQTFTIDLKTGKITKTS